MAGEVRRRKIRALVRRSGVTTDDAAFFETAFVHESAVREGLAGASNERLEFFGDAVLGLVVARSLFERYPDAAEGELALRKSSLVADAALAETALRLGFDELLVLGAGLAKMPPARRRSALADAYEAFVALVFVRLGLDAAARFVGDTHVAVRERSVPTIDDPKTILQEWTQKRYGTIPSYADLPSGPDHERTFESEVVVADGVRATGVGPSKKTAQRAAAARALEMLGAQYDDVFSRTLSRAISAGKTRALANGAPTDARAEKSATTGAPAAEHAKGARPSVDGPSAKHPKGRSAAGARSAGTKPPPRNAKGRARA